MVLKRQNPIVLDFRNVTKRPANIRKHNWIKTNLKFNIDQVLCIQYDHIRNKVYVKLISQVIVQTTVAKFQGQVLIYTDEDGNNFDIEIFEESEGTFIKIFDFPIELENEKIIENLSKYGKVKSIKNEKWHGEGLYNCESGVRVVEIVITRNIPSYMKIEGRTSLVTYPNQIRTCMICDVPGHVRKDCPMKPSNKIREIRRPAVPLAEDETGRNNITYAQVLRENSEIVEAAEMVNQNWYDDVRQNEIKETETSVSVAEMEMEATPRTLGSETPCPNQQAEKIKRKRQKKEAKITSSSEEEKKVPKLTIKLTKRKEEVQIEKEKEEGEEEVPDLFY